MRILITFCTAISLFGNFYGNAAADLGDSLHAMDLTFNTFMKNVDKKVDEALEMATPHLQDALYLNDTHYTKDLEAHTEILKKEIKKRFRFDAFSMIQAAAKLKSDKNRALNDQEQFELGNKLKTSWDSTLQDRVKSWMDKDMKPWVQKIQGIWTGIESEMEHRIRQSIDFMGRHILSSSSQANEQITLLTSEDEPSDDVDMPEDPSDYEWDDIEGVPNIHPSPTASEAPEISPAAPSPTGSVSILSKVGRAALVLCVFVVITPFVIIGVLVALFVALLKVIMK